MTTPPTPEAAEVDWAAMQQEWETTEIGVRALAKKYGIGSHATVIRRITNEGWVRDMDAVEARRTLAEVIADAAAITARAEESPRGAAAVSHPIAPAVRQIDPPADGAPDLSPEGVLEAHLRSMASLRDATAVRHLVMARVVQQTGLLLAQRLQGVLKPPVVDPDGLHDMGDEPDVLGNLQRLIRVNPDRETLAGLVGAAGKALELGLNMERRALADMAARPQAKKSDSGTQRMTMRQMIDTMPTETAEHLRAWAVKVQQDQRAAEIAASEES